MITLPGRLMDNLEEVSEFMADQGMFDVRLEITSKGIQAEIVDKVRGKIPRRCKE